MSAQNVATPARMPSASWTAPGTPHATGRLLGKDIVAVYLAGLVPLVAGGLVLFDQHDRLWMILLAATGLMASLAGLWRARARLGRSTDVGAMVFQAAMIFWFFEPGFQTSLTSNQWHLHASHLAIENADAARAYLAIGLFYTAAMLAYQLTRAPRLTAWVARLYGVKPLASPGRSAQRLIVFIGLALTFYVIASGGLGRAAQFIAGGRSTATPWDSKGNYGTALSPFHFLASAVLVASVAFSGYLLLTRRVRGWHRVWLAGVALLGLMSVIFESGTRSTLIEAVVPAAIVFYRGSTLGRRFRPRVALVILALALSALAISNVLLVQRTTGEVEGGVDLEVQHNDFASHTAFGMAVIDHAHEPFTYDSPFLHTVTGPIPRVLWRGKPESKAMIVFSYYMWGVDISKTGRNNLPGIVGQYYMGWGWFGVVEIGLWLGFLFRLSDHVLRRMPYNSPGQVGVAMFFAYIFVAFRMIGFWYFMPTVLALLVGRTLQRRRIL